MAFLRLTVGDAPGGLRIFVIYKIQSELVRTSVGFPMGG
jgi:hypothetical protein